MRFGTYHVFQCPPGRTPAQVIAEELERAVLAEELGFDDIWVPEQHFSPYCLCGDALLMAGNLVARTRRVHIGTAVVNLTFTHPLRFLERVALLDHTSGGRVEVGVGRGYQFPQYGVFGVPIDQTRALFDEALDIILRAWGGAEFAHQGHHFQLPHVQVWPPPVRTPGQILLHAVNSPESMARAIERGLPALMARPLSPFAEQVEELARYRTALAVAGLDAEPVLRRATVLKYAFLAPTRAEARTLAREALEWDLAILQHLTTPTTTEMPRGYELYEQRGGRLPDYSYDDWLEHVLLFDEPAACRDKIATLAAAGVQRLLLWMGPGGIEHELLVRSMRLFAEQVLPSFRS
ncbi:MAG TPA: LLM class flavin-dependent oxidoreductase [Candidatus Margulisiibacteriota bacterium]|nr:LLM class flavin-dependent oxidoreductase [Candidatus Margulisiibacteriota bacterium]